MINLIQLTHDYPANLVEQLRTGQIDVGLIPVAAIPTVMDAKIIGGYCIAADGPVKSVALFSRRPLEEVEEVVLDYQSRTSVELAKLLLRDHWKKQVRFVPSRGDEYILELNERRAGLIIGDRALVNNSRFEFVYDLAEGWKDYTGLPFVFAAWVSTRPLPAYFLERFERANELGLHQLEQLASKWPLPGVDILSYYKDVIHYRLDASKRAGLDRFIHLLTT